MLNKKKINKILKKHIKPKMEKSKKEPEIHIDENESYKSTSKELSIIADLLTDICEESTTNKDTNGPIIKPFISKKIPSVSIKSYLERLAKYSKIENNTLLLILIYIDKVCDINKIRLNYFNIHKMILASMIIAIKYNEDDYFSNSFYAKVGGVSKSEIDVLEYEFLVLIEFNLYVSDDLFLKYYDYIKNVEDDE